MTYATIHLGTQYTVIGPAWEGRFAGNNRWLVVRNQFLGSLLVRILNWCERHKQWVMQYDLDSLDVREGDPIPMYSGTYWLMLPYRIANRFCTRVDLDF